MQPDPGPVVIIGLKEIYDAVTRLTAQVAMLIHQHDDQVREVNDHESRLRSLERSRWPLPSAAVLLSAAALVLAFLQPG